MAGHARLGSLGLVLLPLAAAPALAQEVYALGGAQYTRSLDETTYSFAYEYLQNLSEHFDGTFTWLNEGHVTAHHRDGYSVQLWARWLNAPRAFRKQTGGSASTRTCTTCAIRFFPNSPAGWRRTTSGSRSGGSRRNCTVN